MKKTNKSLVEAISDIRGIAGANKSGLIPSDEITAVSASFQDESERLSKRYIDVAIDRGAIDLNKEGLGQAGGGQTAATSAGPNPLQSQPFVNSLHALGPDELQKLKNLLLQRAGNRAAAESVLDEGIKDFFKGLGQSIGKAGAIPQGVGRAIKRGYSSGVASMGGGEQTFQQVARQVANTNPEQAKAIIDYIDNILANPTANAAQSGQQSQGSAQPAASATSNSTASPAPSAPTAAAAPTANAAPAATAASKPATKNSAANYEKVKKDVQTINAAITGITKQINPNLAPEDKVKLAREIVNIMADNKKARPEAWQNAYATVKTVLKNVGTQVDATLPKGSKNVTQDLISALNAGQTRNQTAVSLGKSSPSDVEKPKLGKSSTAKTMGKTAAATQPAVAPGPTGPLRRVAEDKTLDTLQVYFLNKFLAELDLSWKDIGYTLLESKSKTYTLKDSKIHELDTLLENVLNEFEQGGYSAAEYMWDVIQKQIHPVDLNSLPKQKLVIANAVLAWEKALKDQVERKGEYTGKFDAATQAAFEEIWEAVAAVAMAAYRPSNRRPYF